MTALVLTPLLIRLAYPMEAVLPHRPVLDPPPTIQTPEPDPGLTPVPGPSPTPGPSGTGSSSVITQIFEVVFSADSLSDALANVLEAAAQDEVQRLESQAAQVSGLLTGILQPPASDHYAGLAGSTLKTAAALAPALFLVRLVLYHWDRIMDDRDSLLRVFGDWISAGFLAVSAGPFLDRLVQAGWWMAGAALGETYQLATQFLAVASVSNAYGVLVQSGPPSLFTGVIAIAAGLGGLVGVVGLAAAFAVSQAVLFVLGTIAPVVAVLAVVPQLRWTRGIWLKAVAILALVPVAAGGIFKAGVSLAAVFTGAGPVDLIIRLFWLWGAVGFMLSMAGILGKVTLSTAAETTTRIGRGARQIVTAVAAAGGGFGSAPAAGTAAGGAASGPSNPPSQPGGLDPLSKRAGPPMFHPASGSSERPAQRSSAPVSGSTEMDAHIDSYYRAALLDPAEIRERYPGDDAGIRAAFYRQGERLINSPDPLKEAARISGADDVWKMLEEPGPDGGSA